MLDAIVTRNLAATHPLARLKAINEMRSAVNQWIDVLEQETVDAARRWNPSATWEEIGRAVSVTGMQASRRYGRTSK